MGSKSEKTLPGFISTWYQDLLYLTGFPKKSGLMNSLDGARSFGLKINTRSLPIKIYKKLPIQNDTKEVLNKQNEHF